MIENSEEENQVVGIVRQGEGTVGIQFMNLHRGAERRLQRANSAHAVVVVRRVIHRHHLIAQTLQEEREFAILRTHVEHAPVPVEEAAVRPCEQFLQVPQRRQRVVGIPLEVRLSQALFRAARAFFEALCLFD